ncbi:regulator of gene activity isoform X1 [Sabethes cyaneus]|uniref:regulator of gene activity isoform X1 n=1 Tax=Sabethes cyaneus TaxID=53552 RepID=UPI00237E44B8|nr:regulator of gene activity isoform X1 [Sabethes cyaneus]XP_053697875.1 regulator of gene activity isoform X1 [Sabethes cyaneus]XP_053697876.1 regulator of gene activity isoform X1 [Sabethes cyaneus]
MANLNFQQPPRSIPSSASLSGRGGTAGGFGSSLSGHVTPTSGMFPTAATGAGSFGTSQPPHSQQQQQQQPGQQGQQSTGQGGQNQPPQLSPSTAGARNGGNGGGASSGGTSNGGSVVGGSSANPATSSASTNGSQQQLPSSNSSASSGANARNSLFGGQRGFADRRPMPGLSGTTMSNMVSFMQPRGYGSQSGNSINNFHSVFDNGTAETGTPPLLDLSEFPSLTNARGGQSDQSLPQSNALQPPGSKPYGKFGMVKQPTSEQTEFTMSSEDFPALPGTQNVESGQLAASQGLQGVHHHHHHSDHHGADSLGKTGGPIGGAVGMGMDLQNDAGNSNVNMDKGAMKRGVQTSPNGMVTNIPASMVNNQFGMVGLLTFIRAAESDPNLVTLAMGQDLTALGLNLTSVENLYPSFGGPFADSPARPQDIDYNVPPEYLINMSIRDKLSKLTLQKYKDDLLFYLFYTNVGDVMQLAAAAELHSRDWRYHTEEKVWITRVPGMTPYEKNGTTERGTYYYFDAQNWRRVPKEFQVDTVKLDKCPNLNAYVTMSGQPV